MNKQTANPKFTWKFYMIAIWIIGILLLIWYLILSNTSNQNPEVKATQPYTILPTIVYFSATQTQSAAQFQSDLNQFQENLDTYGATQRAISDKGGYTAYEESIWQFCHDRWTYYDKLNGGYSGDKYTAQVFKDAASKFGISASSAQSIWDKVEKKKLGN